MTHIGARSALYTARDCGTDMRLTSIRRFTRRTTLHPSFKISCQNFTPRHKNFKISCADCGPLRYAEF